MIGLFLVGASFGAIMAMMIMLIIWGLYDDTRP